MICIDSHILSSETTVKGFDAFHNSQLFSFSHCVVPLNRIQLNCVEIFCTTVTPSCLSEAPVYKWNGFVKSWNANRVSFFSRFFASMKAVCSASAQYQCLLDLIPTRLFKGARIWDLLGHRSLKKLIVPRNILSCWWEPAFGEML